MKKAWEIERIHRDSAVPQDRRKHASNWYHSDTVFPHGDDLLKMFWKSSVPGSFAPEIPFLEMAQAWSNQGYDVSEAEKMIPEGIRLNETGDVESLRVLSARYLRALNQAPKIPDHPYHAYEHPMSWESVMAAQPARKKQDGIRPPWKENYAPQIHQGWIGQLAGGSFGTAIEGYIGSQIAAVYGEVDYYITPPETLNDDVVYELILLDAFEKHGRGLSAADIAAEWVRKLVFGWSAEWIALRNLNMGLFPPESGSFLNYYADWIGVQMRGMICGMLAPNWPLEAARLAFTDGIVSHANNGVYGGMAAAAMTALAFKEANPRAILENTLDYLPEKSEYAAKYRFVLSVLHSESDPKTAWAKIEPHFERYNWIHAYPNMAADLFALWYGEGDFTASMKYLALAGYDVDCNAGLVGNVLGIIQRVPAQWADPIGDLLETYIAGKEKLSILELAERTAALARQ